MDNPKEAGVVAGDRKSRMRGIIAGVLVLLCLAYGYFYLTATTTSGDDVFECKAIASLVTSGHAIPESISTPGRPAIFCDVEVRGFFLKRFDHVRIYGVTDRGQQDSIIRSLERPTGQSKARQLVVDFYEKENWKTWSDPATDNRGGERGPETPMRETVIK